MKIIAVVPSAVICCTSSCFYICHSIFFLILPIVIHIVISLPVLVHCFSSLYCRSVYFSRLRRVKSHIFFLLGIVSSRHAMTCYIFSGLYIVVQHFFSFCLPYFISFMEPASLFLRKIIYISSVSTYFLLKLHS
jgi:hypothetical protein